MCLLEFAIVLKLKNNKKNFRGKMHWLQMNPPRECGLINLINSHLAFSFFHFSTTTLLQLVYLCAVCRLFTQMNAYFLLMNSKRCITIYSLNVSTLRFAYT